MNTRKSKLVKKNEHYFRLGDFGKHVGCRWVELQSWREGVRSMKRENRMIQILYHVNTAFWKSWMGKAADSLEKSTQNDDECKKMKLVGDFLKI